jgi:hypothetical protein
MLVFHLKYTAQSLAVVAILGIGNKNLKGN